MIAANVFQELSRLSLKTLFLGLPFPRPGLPEDHLHPRHGRRMGAPVQRGGGDFAAGDLGRSAHLGSSGDPQLTQLGVLLGDEDLVLERKDMVCM